MVPTPFVYGNPKTTFQTICWLMNVAVLCSDGVIGCLMVLINFFRVCSHTEENARNWEKGISIYSYYNFPCFLCAVFAVLSYLSARSDDIELLLWFMFLGAQVCGRVYVGFLTYGDVSTLPKIDPTLKKANETQDSQA